MSGNALIAAVGDVHGHLQLALCILARWQRELGRPFDAVLLCGDVGTFTSEEQLDSATRRHARQNPCELEFMHHWAVAPQPPWIQAIFRSAEEDGLGLTCPVIMVHGNHEGFAHLERLVPATWPDNPVTHADLPAVDSGGHIRLLPSGWRVRLSAGLVVGGIGGMQPGQRSVAYHRMAYIDPEAVDRLLRSGEVDVLITHQGPAIVQGEKGAALLDPLVERGVARVWFHGHAVQSPETTRCGPAGRTTVVPLHGIVFHAPGDGRGSRAQPYDVGLDGWAFLTVTGDDVRVQKLAPPFHRDYSRYRWIDRNGLLVCPDLGAWL